jgi:hypothetical protein
MLLSATFCRVGLAQTGERAAIGALTASSKAVQTDSVQAPLLPCMQATGIHSHCKAPAAASGSGLACVIQLLDVHV